MNTKAHRSCCKENRFAFDENMLSSFYMRFFFFLAKFVLWLIFLNIFDLFLFHLFSCVNKVIRASHYELHKIISRNFSA